MIISVHIRKAAGSSFRESLKKYYGDRLLLDYGDEIGCNNFTSLNKRKQNRKKMYRLKDNIVENYSIIHGHFYADKYTILNAKLEYVTFLRNPVERVLSNYFYLKRNPKRKNADAEIIHKHGYSLEQYIREPDTQNLQCTFLSTMSLEKFKFVGVVEEYSRSINTFNKIFGVKLSTEEFENVNLERKQQYDVSKNIIKLIERYNQKDIELYENAKDMFF